MHLIQVFLPFTTSNDVKMELQSLRSLLTENFGGATAYSHAPVQGVWREAADTQVIEDELIIIETMAPVFDRQWWQALKRRLERSFQQQDILIRALPMEKI